MNKQTKALKDLLEAVEHAIEIGDWKVDGRCDPDLAINRAKKALEQDELNLNCKSVQKRLATQWGYVMSEWIVWSGGDCPVDNKKVDVKYRDGEVYLNEKSEYLFWKHLQDSNDIVAYRISKGE